MLQASFIGDAHTAAGFALLGVRTPAVPDTRDALWRLVLEEHARQHLVVLSAECAVGVLERVNELLEKRPSPPIVILPHPESGSLGDDAIRAALDVLGIGDRAS